MWEGSQWLNGRRCHRRNTYSLDGRAWTYLPAPAYNTAVMFPNQDGTPWSPPARDANAAEEPEPPRIPGFLPPDHPDRRLERYEVSPDLWKYWGPALHGGAAVAEEQGDEVARSRSRSG